MKASRQFTIKEVIGRKAIASQDELRLELKKRGFDVTQATLSRDLREIGIVRIPTGNGMQYALQTNLSEIQILQPMVGSQVVSIRANESAIIIKTLPGCASVVAEFLDVLGSEDIIGTIAGDNTLLVIPSSHKKTHHLLTMLKKKLLEG